MCANCKDNLYYLECKRCKTVSINYRDIIYEGKKFYEIFTCGLCGAETKREGCVND